MQNYKSIIEKSEVIIILIKNELYFRLHKNNKKTNAHEAPKPQPTAQPAATTTGPIKKSVTADITQPIRPAVSMPQPQPMAPAPSQAPKLNLNQQPQQPPAPKTPAPRNTEEGIRITSTSDSLTPGPMAAAGNSVAGLLRNLKKKVG